MKSIVSLITMLSFISIDLIAQQTLSLQDCISKALDQSLMLQEAEIAIENAQLNLSQAQSNRHPNLTGIGGLNYNFGRSIDPTTNEFITSRFTSNNYGLSSGVLLFGGNRLRNAIKQTDIDLEAVKTDKKQSEADIALQVATTYLNTLFAIENINLAETQLKQSEEQLIFINKLIAAGARPKNENLNLLAQISANKQSIIVAKNNRQLSLLQLKQLLRIDPSVEISLQAPREIDIQTDPDLITFAEAYELTLRSQPAVQAAILREKSAQYNLKIAEADLLPTLSLGGNLSSAFSNRGFRFDGVETISQSQQAVINGMPVNFTIEQEIPARRDATFGEQIQDNISLGLGLNLNIPIYNRGLTKTNIQRAKLGIKSSEIAVARVRESIQILVQQALADARAAKNAMVASESTLFARKAALENAQKRFEAGSLNTFDLTSIQTQYDNSAINFLIDKYNYLFAIKVLDFYMGKPIKL